MSKSDLRIQALQSRIQALEQMLLDREQQSYERLDAIARSSEQLQEHYQKAIGDQAQLVASLEQCQFHCRAQQKTLDLQEHQLGDLRQAYASLDDRALQLAANLEREINETLSLREECAQLRHASSQFHGLQQSHSRLCSTIADFDCALAQADERLSQVASGQEELVLRLRSQVSECESRIIDLSSTLLSEQLSLASLQQDHQQQITALEAALASAQNDYSELLQRFSLLQHTEQEQSHLVDSLTGANQQLNAELKEQSASAAAEREAAQQITDDFRSALAASEQAQSVLQNHCRELLDENQSLQEQVKLLQGECQLNHSTLESLRSELDSATALLAERAAQHEAYVASLQADYNQQLVALEGSVATVQADRDELLQRVTTTSDELLALQKANDDLEASLAAADQARLSLQSRVGDLEHQITADAEASVAALDAAGVELIQLRDDVASLKLRLSDSLTENTQLAQQVELLSTDLQLHKLRADDREMASSLALASIQDEFETARRLFQSERGDLRSQLVRLRDSLA